MNSPLTRAGRDGPERPHDVSWWLANLITFIGCAGFGASIFAVIVIVIGA